jgi:hypothetical protein
MQRVGFILVAYHDQYNKPYHLIQHAKQQQKRHGDIKPLFTSFPLHRMGCQETLRSKFPLKLRPAQFLHAPILLLTAHAPILLEYTNSPPCHDGKPCAHHGIDPATGYSLSTNIFNALKKQRHILHDLQNSSAFFHSIGKNHQSGNTREHNRGGVQTNE